MQKRKVRVSLAVLAGLAMLAVLAVTSRAQSTDPLLGTWKLDVGKSKISGPAPKAGTVKYEATGDALKVTVDVDAESGPAHWEYTATWDGKESPVTGNPNVDTAANKKIDARTSEVAMKKAGKATTTNRRVVSPDGKTLTITIKGSTPEGQPVDDVQVYVKQ
jgi:hypothetical protein